MNPTELLTALALTLTIIEGDQCVAKDRNLLGHWTTSDPQVNAMVPKSGASKFRSHWMILELLEHDNTWLQDLSEQERTS